MSTEVINPNESVGAEENNSSVVHSEQPDGSTANGAYHGEGLNSMGEQNESSKEAYETDQQEKYDKNELEAESLRKVFIGGLSYKTDDQVFREYFSKYGDIVDCIIMRDRDGRSRGFGFVTYASSAMVDRLMAARPHVLDAREIEPKRAVPREESGKPESSLSAKKLFVGGIREGAVNETDLKEYFCKYGNIVDTVIMKTNEGKLRGFGFVEFDDYDPVDKIVLEKHHVIKGNPVNVEKALPKDQTNRARMAASNYAGGRGGGGMRGPSSRGGGGWGPMGGESHYGGGGGGYRSSGGGGGSNGGYGGGMDYGNRPGPYGGGYSGDMGGGGNGNMMGFGGSTSMGGSGYGMGGPNRGGYDDAFGAFGASSGFGFGQNYGSSPGGGPMRRAGDGTAGGGGGGRGGGGGGGGPSYGRGGGGRGGFRGRN